MLTRTEDARRVGPRAPRVPAAVVERRVHDDAHLLIWLVHGGCAFRFEDATHYLEAGQAMWIPAGIPHSLDVDVDSVILPFLFPIADVATAPVPTGLTVVEIAESMKLLLLALQQSRVSVIATAENISSQVLRALAHAPRVQALPMPSQEPALQVAEELRRNPADDRSVEELARSVHASTRTLQRLFRSETGMTLREWRMRNRMHQACDLLRCSVSVQAVAHRVGYSEAAFRRAFKQYAGMPPSRFGQQFARSR